MAIMLTRYLEATLINDRNFLTRPTLAHDRILGAFTSRKVSRCNILGRFLTVQVFLHHTSEPAVSRPNFILILPSTFVPYHRDPGNPCN